MGTASFHRFHGGKARHIRNQIETHLQEELPDAAIILIGGNDLPTSRENPTPIGKVATQIMDSALLCKQYNVKDVCVSSVLPRKEPYMERRRKELNENLRSRCELHDFIFIDNDVGEDKIIFPKHFYDNVHLDNDGSDLLAKKFGGVLNHLHSD